MSLSTKRVLIVDDANSTLFALSQYLTFRGFRVDGAQGMDDACALVRHLYYDAVVFGWDPLDCGGATRLSGEVRRHHVGTKLVALVAESTASFEVNAAMVDADEVLGRHLPTTQLAQLLYHSLAA